jgi:hypothetical protein
LYGFDRGFADFTAVLPSFLPPSACRRQEMVGKKRCADVSAPMR